MAGRSGRAETERSAGARDHSPGSEDALNLSDIAQNNGAAAMHFTVNTLAVSLEDESFNVTVASSLIDAISMGTDNTSLAISRAQTANYINAHSGISWLAISFISGCQRGWNKWSRLLEQVRANPSM